MPYFKGFRYRLYPDPVQERLFRKTAGCCRLVYNLALEQRSAFAGRRYAGPSRSLGYPAQRAQLKDLKTAAPFLREVPHHCLQEALADLDTAFQKFCKGEARYPRYRSKYRRLSFRFPDPLQFDVQAIEVFPARSGAAKDPLSGEQPVRHGRLGVQLPKAGVVPWIMHRPIEGTPKSITVSCEAGDWYASVLCELPDDLPEPTPTSTAAEVDALRIKGADAGIEVPLAASDGEAVALPRISEGEIERQRRLQRTIARRKKGSQNRKKARRDLARLQARQRRRRRDAAHKACRHLLRNCDALAFEALRLKNMTASAKGTAEEPGTNVAQKAGLNRTLLDLAFGQVRRVAAWQAQKSGKRVVLVEPAGTSQECPECHHAGAENRPRRDLFRCAKCGFEWHADFVAAINIEDRGRQALRDLAQAAAALHPEPAGAGPARRRTSGGSPRRGPRRAPPGSGKRTGAGDAVPSAT